MKQIVINIGSKNPAKVSAAEDSLKEYDIFKNAKIVGIETDSGISEQPLTLSETIKGAMTRAKNCFIDCDYSIGVESGLMDVPETKSGYLNICICAIYDGKSFHLGMSSGFEYPKIAIDAMLKNKTNISNAYRLVGLTEHEKLGATHEGIIGQLTKGRVTRKSYTRDAIVMAMIHLENSGLY